MRSACAGIIIAVGISFVACGPPTRPPGGGTGDDSGVFDGIGDPRTHCSSDLRDVLNERGEVVFTCPEDQGCHNGVCVDACAAAASGKGNVGCEFLIPTPSMYPGFAPPCLAVFIANTWAGPATVTIERGGTTYSASTHGRVPDGTPNAAAWPAVVGDQIASDGVAVLFLSSDPASASVTGAMTCPITPAVSAPGGTAVWTGGAEASGIGTAWRIKTNVPVSAYDIVPFGGAPSHMPSAQLLLPTSAWDTTYLAAGPTPNAPVFPGQAPNGPGWGQVTALQDNTTITIIPTTTLPGGPGVAEAPAGQSTTYTLNAGQYVQWQGPGDMAGSRISATAPVSYTGGSTHMCINGATTMWGGCDAAHQQIPPVTALGFEYLVAPYETRRSDLQPESIRYRFVGAIDGTVLTYEPNVPGAPTALAQGQVVDFEATMPFMVKSQGTTHPFYVAQYMMGYRVESLSRAGETSVHPDFGPSLGDEEFVNVFTPAQWLSRYVFFTDPTYATTNLVVVRKAGPMGFADVTVDCLGPLTGWRPIGTSGAYQLTTVDLQRITPVGTCKPGRQVAQSTAPFGVTVWGLDSAASYAYPAGGGVVKINSVVIF